MTTAAAPSPAKRAKMSGPTIGTHNGHFHADEALAVYLLRLLPTYADSQLIRTRDSSILETCHTVVDVGGEYDPARNRFDHHQRGFSTTFPSHTTKLSSAGLVYLHFGKNIIARQTGLDVSSEDVALLHDKLYDDLIEAFDANDNGINAYDTAELARAGVKKRFSDRGFSIAAVVNRFNRHWESSEGKTAEQLQAEEDQRFLEASSFTGEQFISELIDKHRAWLPARAVVKEAFTSRFEHDPKGRILVLPYRKEGIPWSDHLYALEAASASVATQVPPSASSPPTASPAQVLYVLFAESDEPDSKWRIRAVAAEPDSFENRHPLPAAWRGLRDDELSKVAGVEGCVFVHATGFIGGNQSFQGALEMAKKAVEME